MYSPISVQQINNLELKSFAENTFSAIMVAKSGDQIISGDKTFVGFIIPSGGIKYIKKYINGNYSPTSSDLFLSVNSSGSSKVLSFQETEFVTGKEYIIKDFTGLSETNPIILSGVSGVTFDYAPTLTISNNFASIYLVAGSGKNYEVY